MCLPTCCMSDVPTYLLCVRCGYLPVVCQMWLPVITGRQMTQPCRRCIRPQLRFSLSFYITATNNCAVWRRNVVNDYVEWEYLSLSAVDVRATMWREMFVEDLADTQSHSRSFKITPLSTAYVSFYVSILYHLWDIHRHIMVWC